MGHLRAPAPWFVPRPLAETYVVLNALSFLLNKKGVRRKTKVNKRESRTKQTMFSVSSVCPGRKEGAADDGGLEPNQEEEHFVTTPFDLHWPHLGPTATAGAATTATTGAATTATTAAEYWLIKIRQLRTNATMELHLS